MLKGNQTGRYEIARLLPGEKQIIRVLHDYRVSLIDYTIDPARIEPYAQFQPAVLQPYLTPSPGIESDHPLIQAKAREVVGRETNPFKKAKKIFTFVNEYMTYSEEKFGTNEGKESEYGALYALQTGKGVCEDYADLMVALLRATGVPARTVSGWTGEISGKSIKLIDANTTFLPGHMWLEYYLPGYGWIPADPTFTYTVNNVRQVEYSRLTGIRQPSFVDSCEMAGHAVSYSFRGDVDVNTNVTIYKLGVDGVMPLPVGGTQAPLLYLEDIPLIFDVNPVIENGRTLVPMRGIFQALGAAVEWDGVTQRIVALSPERKVELQIGQTQAWVNGELRTLDVSPCILDSRTMIPLRFVGEALGCQVDWDGNLRTINLRFH
ncbi:MAG: stalk domain-containing protein [Peptococcia bacterium]